MTTVVAIGCAVLAACCFAASVGLQHGAVRAVEPGKSLSLRALGRVIRSRRWLGGTVLGVTGTALHVVALSLAPLVIVQPIGVLSLVLTVLISGRGRRGAVVCVCVGVGGFVLVAALAGTETASPGSVQPVVLAAIAVVVLGMRIRGPARCFVLAAGAAVLFGTGSALIRAATQNAFLGPAAESVLLIVVGGWVVHQAYASGPPAVVIAATTVIDPLTAVLIGLSLYGEAAHLTAASAAAQAGFAVLAATGVIVLARSMPDPRRIEEAHDMLESTGRLRILIAADTFPPDVNGAANFADQLARGLAGRGHDVHVVCPAHAATTPATESDDVITVHRVRSLRTPFHPTFRVSTPRQASRTVAPLIDRLRPDVVHVQSHFSVGRSVVRAATDRAVPVIATNHFMPENLLGFAPMPHWLRKRVASWAWRDLVHVYRQAAVVTSPTPRAVELLSANGFPGRAEAISCGIDVAHYPAHQAGDGTDISVLFVGRLDKEKNVGELVRAVALLPAVRAEIVGDGSCREDLIELARRLDVDDRVRFHGFVSDEELVRAYRSCDVFCMPGTAELQSLATMEAMAASLPVVAADAMALPHLVRPGVNGFLYPPGGVDRLAAALGTLAADPAARAAMGRAGREIIAGHDISRTLDAFEGLYLESAGVLATRAALAS